LGLALVLCFLVNLVSALTIGYSFGVEVTYEPSYKDLPPDQIPPDSVPSTGSRPSDWYLTDWWKLVHSYKADDWWTDAEKATIEAIRKNNPDIYDLWLRGVEIAISIPKAGVYTKKGGDTYRITLEDVQKARVSRSNYIELRRLSLVAFGRWYLWLGTQYKPLAYTDKPPVSSQLPYWTDVKFDPNGSPKGFGASTNYPIKVHSSIAHNKFVWNNGWRIEGGSYIAPDGKEWPLPIWNYPSHSEFVFPSDIQPLWGWIDNHIEPWWLGMHCDNREAIEWTFLCAMTFWAIPTRPDPQGGPYSYLGSAPSGRGFLYMIGGSNAFPKGVPMNYYQNSWATYFGTAYDYHPEKVAPFASEIVGNRYYFCDKCPFAGRDSAVLDQHRLDFHGIKPSSAYKPASMSTSEVIAYLEQHPEYMPHSLLNLLDTERFALPKQYLLIPISTGEGKYSVDISNWWFLVIIAGFCLVIFGGVIERRMRREVILT